MSLALLALFAAAFAIGTSEFVIAGIIPDVAADLSISIPDAGLLVSLYALGVAIGGPVVAIFTARFAKKPLLLIYVAIFIAAYVCCALAPNYQLLLASRVAASLIHGAYFGTALVVAASIVPENRRGFAISLILAGLTVANIVGVPLGTALGHAFGWRMTFWAIAALGAVSLLLVAALIPALPKPNAAGANLRAEFKALSREPVYTSLAIIIVQTIGQFALFTYIAPLLTGVSSIAPETIPWLLLLIGIGSTIGILGGGRLADWRLMASLTGMLALQVVIYLLIGVFVGSPWIVGPLLLVWGATVFGFASPAQSRILSNTQDAPTLAANLIPSAFNVAIAFGAWLGGEMIRRGAPYESLPWVGLAGAIIATLIAALSWRRERGS